MALYCKSKLSFRYRYAMLDTYKVIHEIQSTLTWPTTLKESGMKE